LIEAAACKCCSFFWNMVVSDVGDALLLQMDALEVPYEDCMCSGLVIVLCFCPPGNGVS
jgi:hypothetical protein